MHLFPLASVEPVFGMPTEHARKFQHVAAQQDIVIDVRSTNPHSVAWLRRGALPKPEPVKAKTIDDLDIHLGAQTRHRGLVGFFRPSLPRNSDERLLRRFDQRCSEYDSLRGKMDLLARRGEYVVRDGVVHGFDKSGRLQPLTGDHDIFDIHAAGGAVLGGRRYEQAISTMIAMNMGVTHGAHMFWNPTTKDDRAIFDTIARNTSPKLRFHPDGTMTAGDYRRHVPAFAIPRQARPLVTLATQPQHLAVAS
ncbi:hypothetical protein [Actinosynnema sp. NPDC020468]|uniref:hypothetical protein n=1 Tax=Actinosynnema sp. NPDC020468 TaxID=3154488 RepID=UPI0033C07B79